MENEMMEKALAYLVPEGYRPAFKVFPVTKDKKRPLTSNGFYDATDSPEQIREWWQKYPYANIAIPTGEVSGILVIDIDQKPDLGKYGEETFFLLQKELGELPETWEVITGSGGRHLYFRYPTGHDIRNSEGDLAQWVDVRGNGGYVVAPGSRYYITEQPYEWEAAHDPAEIPLADLPPAWLQRLETKPKPAETPFMLPDGKIEEGQRNRTLFKYGASLRARSEKTIRTYELMAQFNNEKCFPPLDDEELKRIFESVMKYQAGADPAQIVADPEAVPEEVHMKTAAELDSSPIEWLIPEWVPKKGITLLCSDGGTGKTFVWVSILSSLSRGESTFLRYSKEDRHPLTVMCFSGEDPENVLRKRFEAAGANLKNILVCAQDTEEENITFDSPKLAAYIEKYKPAVIFFDPLQSFIGSSVDMSRRNQMRQAIKPLAVLASRYDMAVMIAMHTNKRSNEYGRNKMADSSDIWDQARSVIMSGFTPDKSRYVSLEKSNYSDFSSVGSVIFNLDGGKVNFLRVEDKKMADYVKEERQNRNIENGFKSKKSMCCDDMLLVLSENDEKMDSEEIKKALSDLGYSDKTIRNAREELRDNGYIELKKDSTGAVTYCRIK